MDWTALLVYSTPVALAALGETVTEKAGVINIGIEGTMLVGAYMAMLVSLVTGDPWLGLAAGLAVGALFSALQGLFTLGLAADQVVVGAAVNLFALGLTGTLFRAQFGQSGQLLSLPALPKAFGLDPIVVLAIALVPALAWLLFRTKWGLAVRAAGEYPKAVEASGFSALGLRWQAFLLGGALTGLGGAYLSLGVAQSFAENMTEGRGFVAIAMVTFGRWQPLGAFLASLLIGVAETLQFTAQAQGWNVPYQLFLALPYLLALAVLMGMGRGRAAPAALGVPFRRSR